jgi:preprotein translocase subunit YajC
MNSQLTANLVAIGAMIAIFYFIVLRPQQQQKRKQEQTLLAVKKGDEIVTVGGIIGEVVHVKTTGAEGGATLDDRITIRSGESRLVVERGRIARVGVASGTAASARGSGQTTAPEEARNR